jgi:hypothetical protein
MADYKIVEGGVQRASDGATIPLDEGNGDYRRYLEWVKDGNQPDPADGPPQEELDRVARKQTLRANTLFNQLKSSTPEQVDTWVQNNINSLADAKQLLRTLAMVICVLVRERD